MEKIKDRLCNNLPTDPGVYIMKAASGEILYVGKARNLKKRILSYFSKASALNRKTEVLVRKIADLDTILTNSEKEALILEANLIKLHRPRYNVNLKDDKRYPFLRLNKAHPYPNLVITRRMQDDRSVYFGPFSSAKSVRYTLSLIHKTFRLRKCNTRTFKNRQRPCLNYQMGLCLGPCVFEVDKEEYSKILHEVTLFLKGRTPQLIKSLEKEMEEAALRQEFERAAVIRDKIFSLKTTIEKQNAVSTDRIDRDVIAMAEKNGYYAATVMSVRSGYLLSSMNFDLGMILDDIRDLAGNFIRQYYEKHPFVPKEILVSEPVDSLMLTSEILSSIKGEKVRILRPQKGDKRVLVNTAKKNAEEFLKKLTEEEQRVFILIERLKKRLMMKKRPARIECFDISNLAGTDQVAGMAVFIEGRPVRSEYRKYILKRVEGPDDYAAMEEVLRRRFSSPKTGALHPDLLVVDGGRGQLGMAIRLLDELGLKNAFSVIGIAKKDPGRGETEDKIYLPGRANPVNFGKDTAALRLIQHIRDEAHRFALSFHRKRRSKRVISTILSEIPGIGEKRQKVLLSHFKSIEKIRAASREEILSLPGIDKKLAKNIIEHLSAVKQPF